MLGRAALALLVIALGGCSYHNAPFEAVEGKSFAVDRVDQIREGTATQEVLQLLGEPLEREGELEGERWRYFFREERVNEQRLLDIVPIRKRRWERHTELTLLIVADEVARISYRSEVIPPG